MSHLLKEWFQVMGADFRKDEASGYGKRIKGLLPEPSPASLTSGFHQITGDRGVAFPLVA
jgi:hypothetical protein